MGPLASLPGQAPMARWALALALALAPTPHHHTQPPARQAHPAIGCTWGGKPPSVGLFIDDSLTNPLGGLTLGSAQKWPKRGCLRTVWGARVWGNGHATPMWGCLGPPPPTVFGGLGGGAFCGRHPARGRPWVPPNLGGVKKCALKTNFGDGNFHGIKN